MPGGWTFCARRTICAVAALLLVLSPLEGSAPPAGAAESRLPFNTFFELYVDQPRRHVFVSGGPGTNAVLVFGFDGRLTKRIEGLAGAADMLVEGDRMYVALASSNVIAIVDLKKLETIDTIDVSPYSQPRYLSKTRDTIYFTHSCTDHTGAFASIDLTTRVPLAHDGQDTAGCVEHAVVPNDPNTMFVWPSDGMGGIKRFNVSARRPILIAESEDQRDYVDEVRFSSDGETYYVRNTMYYSDRFGVDQRRLSDDTVLMNYQQAGTAYALTPDERFLFSNSLSYDSDLVVYRTGSAAPVMTMDLDHDPIYEDEAIAPGSLGAAPAGDRVFAVVTSGLSYDPILAFRVIWPQYPVAVGRGDQSTPAAGGGYTVWSNQMRRKGFSRLMARGDGKTFRVSPPRSHGFAGGIDGTKLVYQHVRGRRSDLRLYDLKRRRQISSLDRFNTRGWEWHPTISGGRVLFTRVRGKHSQAIVGSLAGGRERVLARESAKTTFLVPGQINGVYATWSVCGRVCETYRINLKTGGRVKMPRPPRRVTYASSVTKQGVVYYAESGNPCGSHVEILRWQDGRVTEIEDLPQYQDVFYTYTDDPNDRVLFDRIDCNTEWWDVLSFRDSVTSGDARRGKPSPDTDTPEPLPPLEGAPWFGDALPGGGPK
ncbi:MAG TPA: hypothetical protein VEU29_01945 [Actinomycetota bacterium]|nr:hypothetical protein [Actinomycetota bacterium]